jgi:uncharacterized membrane protein
MNTVAYRTEALWRFRALTAFVVLDLIVWSLVRWI